MKTIVEINNNNYGSTGNIMNNIADVARNKGYNVFTCCKNSKEGHKYKKSNQIYIGIWIERIISDKLSYLTSLKDHFNIFGTIKFINELKKINPDCIHLHNIHGSFINIRLLFKYIKKYQIPIIWTFHDIWPLTGQCTTLRCLNWKHGCGDCNNLHSYPEMFALDLTKIILKEKQTLFSNINNLTNVCPSLWLSNLIKDSYLNYGITTVINNGIDLKVFKPILSNFKKEHGITNEFLIVFVANYWNEDKGLNVICQLAKELPSNYKITIVGTNKEIDSILPKGIISIHKTNNQTELAEIYSSADLFVNPTQFDNFPTVNIESLACGTPVLTFDVGGSKEIIDDTCGSFVKLNDIEKLKSEIIRICNNKPYTCESCIKRASKFDMNDKFNEYVNLYKKIIG